jgi:uncharacterized NAD-dependent epimerase/dehydratase family protein
MDTTETKTNKEKEEKMETIGMETFTDFMDTVAECVAKCLNSDINLTELDETQAKKVLNDLTRKYGIDILSSLEIYRVEW